MKSQHQVVLARKHQGNKLETIEACITLIHKEVGTVIEVSKSLQKHLLGFESDAFTIAPSLHTFIALIRY
jgi:hypothetical protein